LHAGKLYPLVGVLGTLALAAVGVSLAYDERLVPWALLLAAAEYTLVDLVHTQSLVAAPFYGTGLLLTAELTYASRELRQAQTESGKRFLARLLTVGGTALTASFVTVLAAGSAGPGGAGAAALALVAAAGLLLVPLLMLRRHP
jgi:hypothetical protein